MALSPDHQLVLACCRARSRIEPAWRPPRPERIDWGRFLHRAERLGLAGLVHTTLGKVVPPTDVPTNVLTRLGRRYYSQAGRNARLTARLDRVLASFAASRLPVVVLKGTALAQVVYGNIALRVFKDHDLLVQPNDLEQADRLIRTLGYRPDESYRRAEWYRAQHHHLAPYRAADGSLIVELHHHVVPPPLATRIPVEELWSRARVAGLQYGAAFMLAPVDLLLHLCLELAAAQRFLGGLRLLCDIDAAIERFQTHLDWNDLLVLAGRYGVGRHVCLALRLAGTMLGAAVPAAVLERLDPGQGALERRAATILFGRSLVRYEGESSVAAAGLMAGLSAFLLAGGRLAKFRELLHLVARGASYPGRRLRRARERPGLQLGREERGDPRDRPEIVNLQLFQ